MCTDVHICFALVSCVLWLFFKHFIRMLWGEREHTDDWSLNSLLYHTPTKLVYQKRNNNTTLLKLKHIYFLFIACTLAVWHCDYVAFSKYPSFFLGCKVSNVCQCIPAKSMENTFQLRIWHGRRCHRKRAKGIFRARIVNAIISVLSMRLRVKSKWIIYKYRDDTRTCQRDIYVCSMYI